MIPNAERIIAYALHWYTCQGGRALTPQHRDQAAAIIADLGKHGLAIVPVSQVAHTDQATALLRDVACELRGEGRIGRTLLTGSYPTSANVARDDLLRRITNLRGGRRV